MMKKVLFCLIGVLLGGGVARADLYQIVDIPVAAELASAKEAREVALANGQVEAFWHLMRKMVVPAYLRDVPVLSQEEVINLVQNVSIADEKNTATKYMATVAVHFKPKDVQDFLTDNKIPFLMQAPPVSLAIPVLKRGETVALLEEGNPVFTFLKQFKADNPLFEVVVPVGDAEDVTAVHALWHGGEAAGWASLLSKYGAGQVLFFEVEQQGPFVTARTRVLPAEKDVPAVHEVQTAVPSGNLSEVLAHVWQDNLDAMEADWRAVRTNDLKTPALFWVSVPIASLQDWQSIYLELMKAGFLAGVDVRAFRPRQVLAALRYKGAGDQLNAELRAIGLQVRPLAGSGAWELTRRPIETEGETE